MANLKAITYGKFLEIFLGIFMLVFVVFPKWTTLVIIGIGVVVIIGYVKKHLKFKMHPFLLLFILLYVLYLIGLLFTENIDVGLKYLEYKLSLLIFPILLGFRPKWNMSLGPAIGGLILGTYILTVYGLILGFKCYFSSGSFLCLFSSSISPTHHPTYLSVIVLIATVGAWVGWKKELFRYRLLWIIPFTVLSLVFQILLGSLAGVLFLGAVLLFVGVYLVYKNVGKWIAFVALLVFSFGGFLALKHAPQLKSDWLVLNFYSERYFKDPMEFVRSRSYPMSGMEARVIMWTISGQILSEHPMGVGTGNVDDYLGERLRKMGHDELADEKLNPHNQYLQTAVEIGIVGLLTFVLIIILGIFLSIKHRKWLLLALILSLAFNCLFESMLQRQSGIVFYTFWICLLLIPARIKQIPEAKEAKDIDAIQDSLKME
ncbi:MAG: O-antigen ligase family protein [Crocinitomicaceae bacterium]|nr:O-antigen ligase family protein [Crocinitomicaceae bacterium]